MEKENHEMKEPGAGDKTYEDGLREAWELARRISYYSDSEGFTDDQLYEIFGTYDSALILEKYTPQKAAEKIAGWEIKENDVVMRKNTDLIGVVTFAGEKYCSVTWTSGTNESVERKFLKKTGRTIDIAGLLAQIGGTEMEGADTE